MRMPPAHCRPRFEDHRADFARMLVEQVGQGVGGFVRAAGGILAGPGQVGVGRGCEQGLGQQRCVDAAIQRDVAHGEGADGLAVVAVLQRDKAGAMQFATVAEVVEGHLQRHFHASRAVVGVEHLGQRRAVGLARGDLQQAFGQADGRLVAKAGQHHLLQRVRLGADGGGGCAVRHGRTGWSTNC